MSQFLRENDPPENAAVIETIAFSGALVLVVVAGLLLPQLHTLGVINLFQSGLSASILEFWISNPSLFTLLATLAAIPLLWILWFSPHLWKVVKLKDWESRRRWEPARVVAISDSKTLIDKLLQATILYNFCMIQRIENTFETLILAAKAA